jgi:TetR/AcrR family transcriptional regulator
MAVRRVRDAEASRARIFEAAAAEFAAHGFAGAKVDRIAARARANKAMIYYHFESKAGLYRAVVGDMFAATAAAVRELPASGLTPEAQIDRFIEIVAREGQARPHFPRLWLRELADDGRHMGDRNVADLVTIVTSLAAILQQGQAAGRFRPVSPFVAQVGIVGPIFLFLATGAFRKTAAARAKLPIGDIPPAALIEHVKAMTQGALRAKRHSR